MPTDRKFCPVCQQDKPIKDFGLKSPDKRTGRRYRRSQCKRCHNQIRNSNKDPEKERERWRKRNARRARERRENKNTPHWIWQDTRQADKRRGYENDLTKEFIKEQILKGCSYCGSEELRMTLDRIDNSLGHTMSNVVPACIRCNYVRGNMPYEAWLVVARAMKRAVKQGLFGKWTGRAR